MSERVQTTLDAEYISRVARHTAPTISKGFQGMAGNFSISELIEKHSSPELLSSTALRIAGNEQEIELSGASSDGNGYTNRGMRRRQVKVANLHLTCKNVASILSSTLDL